MRKISLSFRLLSILTVFLFAMSFTHTSFATTASDADTSKKLSKTKTTTGTSTLSETEEEPDVKHHSSVEYKCELGNSLVVYTHPEDHQSLAMRWKNRLYKLTRVATSTGALRFENSKLGLLWIHIPSKGMLLDTLRGHQLANECKSHL